MRRIAVVLFSMGDPLAPEDVRPFLVNLFSDPAILRLPAPLRWLVARAIARRRAPVAADVYRRLGGGSPLLENSLAQAAALQKTLEEMTAADQASTVQWRVLVAMRYWTPFTEQVVAEVAAFAPEAVVLLPLYPQWSTTTSASSLAAWSRAAVHLKIPHHAICCYPDQPGFIEALADGVVTALAGVPAGMPVRVLCSAHGLPESIVAAGDPYPAHCARTRNALASRLAARGWPDLECRLCYQSRVGPMTWIGPATDAELRRAAAERVATVVVPIAFVSEHSETLIELDQEFRELAEAAGVPYFARVPTVGVAPSFITGLARLVRETWKAGWPLATGSPNPNIHGPESDGPESGGLMIPLGEESIPAAVAATVCGKGCACCSQSVSG